MTDIKYDKIIIVDYKNYPIRVVESTFGEIPKEKATPKLLKLGLAEKDPVYIKVNLSGEPLERGKYLRWRFLDPKHLQE